MHFPESQPGRRINEAQNSQPGGRINEAQNFPAGQLNAVPRLQGFISPTQIIIDI